MSPQCQNSLIFPQISKRHKSETQQRIPRCGSETGHDSNAYNQMMIKLNLKWLCSGIDY